MLVSIGLKPDDKCAKVILCFTPRNYINLYRYLFLFTEFNDPFTVEIFRSNGIQKLRGDIFNCFVCVRARSGVFVWVIPEASHNDGKSVILEMLTYSVKFTYVCSVLFNGHDMLILQLSKE